MKVRDFLIPFLIACVVDILVIIALYNLFGVILNPILSFMLGVVVAFIVFPLYFIVVEKVSEHKKGK